MASPIHWEPAWKAFAHLTEYAPYLAQRGYGVNNEQNTMRAVGAVFVCLVTQARIDRAVEAQAPSEVKNPDKKHRENSQSSLQKYWRFFLRMRALAVKQDN